MAEDWPRAAHEVAERVAERRGEREAFAPITACAVCDRGGPWIGVAPLTGWITCPGCTADLRRFSRAIELGCLGVR
jgi:hypothetical protein